MRDITAINNRSKNFRQVSPIMDLKPVLILLLANSISNSLIKSTVSAVLENNLVTEYFKMKNINQVTMFSCEDKTKYIKILTSLMEYNIYVSVRNLNTKMNPIEVDGLVIQHGSHGFLLDADCQNIATILHQCAEHELFFDKYKWLIFHTNDTVIEILRNIYMNVNAEITIASQRESELSWNLLDVYNPGYKHGGTLKVHELGTWDMVQGFSLDTFLDLPKYIRRNNLSELHFKGIVVLVDGYPGKLLDYLYNNEENKTIDNFSRYYFLLFTHIKDIHNFSLSVELSPYYGSMVSSNGSFNGLVGALQRKQADVGLTAIYYKVDRSPYVDNLVPTYLMKTRFLFRHPKPALTISGAFFSPLDNTVWLSTWAIMILTALIVRVTFKEEWKLERIRHDTLNYTEHDWSFIALLIFGGICQQDVPRIPNMYSGRIIVFVSVFFTYMLYQFYSGGIVSSLLSDPPKTIKNLEDLLHSDLKVGVEDIVYEKVFFDETSDPIATELFKTKMRGKKNGSDAYYDEKTGMELVKNGEFAFQTDTSTGYAVIAEEFTNEEICELGEVQLYPNQYMTGVVQQDSPFRELFVYSFQRMVEAGIVHRQRIRWTTKKPDCIKVVDSSSIFVGIQEFFPALLFYIVGILITLVIFGAEIWTHRKIQTRMKLVIIK